MGGSRSRPPPDSRCTCCLLVQPIASDEVAAALTEVTLKTPVNGTIEVAGVDGGLSPIWSSGSLWPSRNIHKVVPDVQAR